MLPHIELIANIRHRIPGETRPVLFPNEKQSFILALVEDEPRPSMYDAAGLTLSDFKGVGNAEELQVLRRMDPDFWAPESEMERLVPDDEGEESPNRILARDGMVIPILAERFLDYTPKATNE